MRDVPANKAMICFNPNGGGDGVEIAVLEHLNNNREHKNYRMCTGAWESDYGHRAGEKFLIDLWHAVAFYGIDPQAAHYAAQRVPEYRDMLAEDCLPEQYLAERDGE